MKYFHHHVTGHWSRQAPGCRLPDSVRRRIAGKIGRRCESHRSKIAGSQTHDRLGRDRCRRTSGSARNKKSRGRSAEAGNPARPRLHNLFANIDRKPGVCLAGMVFRLRPAQRSLPPATSGGDRNAPSGTRWRFPSLDVCGGDVTATVISGCWTTGTDSAGTAASPRRNACMIRSVSPASARTGGADSACLRRFACARAARASADDCRNSAAACCCGTGQPEMSSPRRSSRSSKSAIFIIDKACSRSATTCFAVLREAKAPWQSQPAFMAAAAPCQPQQVQKSGSRPPKCREWGVIRLRTLQRRGRG